MYVYDVCCAGETKGRIIVTLADRYKEYLAKAEQAERQAERALDELSKSTWLKVAAGYRDLAKMATIGRPDQIWWT